MKKTILVGASYRGLFGFVKPLINNYSTEYKVAAVCDLSLDRIKVMNELAGVALPGYDDFDTMVKDIRPDMAIIASIDSSHIDYIEKCLQLGIECVCEKPLCIDAEQCRRVRKAQKLNPSVKAVTTHNYRYSPYMLRIKEILDSGKIGKIRSVNFDEYLDWRHGTSYFRRWNRTKKNSGGLLVHKASHHFDLINWFVASLPKNLSAHGRLIAYGAQNCLFKADDKYGPACHKCSKTKEECRYKTQLDGMRDKMYFKSNGGNGYTPDLCVFSPEIDTYDHVSVGYDYANGVHVAYSLCAHASYEGMRISIEGSKARLDYQEILSTSPMETSAVYGSETITKKEIMIIPFEKNIERVHVEKVEGGHGGADYMMHRDLFGGGKSNAEASLEDGIQAVLVGSAANISIETGCRVDIQSLAPVN
ncbi:MAG: hypothetical protein A2017_21820 [Lentisphaerae bacterium GWF2_44_16]|nr:MAG: hypothetical protein A2017_21820 [Lentisphaerae bacterium GWF2_44_16]